jgi:hypothetical protein
MRGTERGESNAAVKLCLNFNVQNRQPRRFDKQFGRFRNGVVICSSFPWALGENKCRRNRKSLTQRRVFDDAKLRRLYLKLKSTHAADRWR